MARGPRAVPLSFSPSLRRAAFRGVQVGAQAGMADIRSSSAHISTQAVRALSRISARPRATPSARRVMASTRRERGMRGRGASRNFSSKPDESVSDPLAASWPRNTRGRVSHGVRARGTAPQRPSRTRRRTRSAPRSQRRSAASPPSAPTTAARAVADPRTRANTSALIRARSSRSQSFQRTRSTLRSARAARATSPNSPVSTSSATRASARATARSANASTRSETRARRSGTNRESAPRAALDNLISPFMPAS